MYVGVDCRKEYLSKTKFMYIKIVSVSENGARFTKLSVSRPHPGDICEGLCYNWQQIKGVGFVEPEFGTQTTHKIYRKPYRPRCPDNPVVVLRWGQEVLDSIVVPLFTPPKPYLRSYAYYSANYQWIWEPPLGRWPPIYGPTPPKDAKSNKITLYLLAYHVNCLDEVSDPWGWQSFTLYYDYYPRERRWFWYYPISGGLMGNYAQYLLFPWKPYYVHLPRVEVFTYRDGSEQFCCPASLDLWNQGADIGYHFTKKL